MRGVHGGHQHRCCHPVAKNGVVGPEADGQGKQETEHSQRQGGHLEFLYILHVHFERGQKHDIIKSHLAEQFETAVAVEHMETIGSDEYSGGNHAYDGRNPQPFEQHRREEDNAQHHEENPRRVGYGKTGGQIGGHKGIMRTSECLP